MYFPREMMRKLKIFDRKNRKQKLERKKRKKEIHFLTNKEYISKSNSQNPSLFLFIYLFIYSLLFCLLCSFVVVVIDETFTNCYKKSKY